MTRAAIFVDAGYLFAQGSVALAGIKQPRTILSLNVTAALAELKSVAATKTDGCALLRVYWYDGASGTKGPTLEQMALAHTDSVKLRLGFINSSGQQKGVDSLIVTDLIDLARNHAICDAVLLSGDEDVRIGVQIAQQFGVRIHLVGITPARGSQSRMLQQEADSTTEWDKVTVAKFLTITAPPIQPPATQPLAAKPAAGGATDAVLAKVADELANAIDAKAITELKALWSTQVSIPPEYDGKLLAICRQSINRELTLPERRFARERFKATAQAR